MPHAKEPLTETPKEPYRKTDTHLEWIEVAAGAVAGLGIYIQGMRESYEEHMHPLGIFNAGDKGEYIAEAHGLKHTIRWFWDVNENGVQKNDYGEGARMEHHLNQAEQAMEYDSSAMITLAVLAGAVVGGGVYLYRNRDTLFTLFAPKDDQLQDIQHDGGMISAEQQTKKER